MLFNVAQYAAANQAPLDFALGYYGAFLNGAERITALNIEITRSLVLDSMTGARAMLDAQDEDKAAQIRATTSKALARKLATYSRSVFEITVQTQEEMTKAITEQANGYQRSMALLLEAVAKTAPANARNALAAIRDVGVASNGPIHKTSAPGKRLAKAA